MARSVSFGLSAALLWSAMAFAAPPDCYMADPAIVAAVPGGPWKLIVLSDQNCMFQGEQRGDNQARLSLELFEANSSLLAYTLVQRSREARDKLVGKPLSGLGDEAFFGVSSSNPDELQLMVRQGKTYAEIKFERGVPGKSSAEEPVRLEALARSMLEVGSPGLRRYQSVGGYCPYFGEDALPLFRTALGSPEVHAEWIMLMCRYKVPKTGQYLDASTGRLQTPEKEYFSLLRMHCKGNDDLRPKPGESWVQCRTRMDGVLVAWVAGDSWYQLDYMSSEPILDRAALIKNLRTLMPKMHPAEPTAP